MKKEVLLKIKELRMEADLCKKENKGTFETKHEEQKDNAYWLGYKDALKNIAIWIKEK